MQVDNGEPLNSPYITKAVKFLLSKQKEDGGWGESFLVHFTNFRQKEEKEEQFCVLLTCAVLREIRVRATRDVAGCEHRVGRACTAEGAL